MTLHEATDGQKLRTLPPRWGKGNGPWKPHEWSLRTVERDYPATRSIWRRAWVDDKLERPAKFANAHAWKRKHLVDALLEYTGDQAFVDRATGEAWRFAEAEDIARDRAA